MRAEADFVLPGNINTKECDLIVKGVVARQATRLAIPRRRRIPKRLGHRGALVAGRSRERGERAGSGADFHLRAAGLGQARRHRSGPGQAPGRPGLGPNGPVRAENGLQHCSCFAGHNGVQRALPACAGNPRAPCHLGPTPSELGASVPLSRGFPPEIEPRIRPGSGRGTRSAPRSRPS